MEQERFVKQEAGSFFGDYLFEQVVPKDHFLRQLNSIVDWKRYTQKLIKLYKGQGQYGRPPFDPAVVLKMLLLAYLYDLSERQVEVHVNENIPAKYFLGLAIDKTGPDHSTLTKFKKRLLKNGKVAAFESILAEIIRIAFEQGIKFGSIQIMDSVHTVANVNTSKDDSRQKKGKGPHDPDAKWGAKHSRKFKDENGETKKQVEYFYGYKAHMSMNSENGMITSVKVTPGNAYDGHYLPPLLDKDLHQGIPLDTVAADRGYDDGNNHTLLDSLGLHSAIRLNDTRTRKKNQNKEIWVQLKKTTEYQQGCKERYKIERKFGEAKQGHGLGRCRYIGQMRYTIQAIFIAMALNLKRMVKILTGCNFKGRARVTV